MDRTCPLVSDNRQTETILMMYILLLNLVTEARGYTLYPIYQIVTQIHESVFR